MTDQDSKAQPGPLNAPKSPTGTPTTFGAGRHSCDLPGSQLHDTGLSARHGRRRLKKDDRERG